MILAAFVVGAQKGYIYIRHEYERQAKILEAELDRCRRMGLLGDSILGSDLSFDVEIFISPGGYICGEGSALLQAIEGKRAEPRNRPPNSAHAGTLAETHRTQQCRNFSPSFRRFSKWACRGSRRREGVARPD